jgi:hypothetical protein
MSCNAPKLLEFKKKYNIWSNNDIINNSNKHCRNISKNHTYSNIQYRNVFNKIKFKYNKSHTYTHNKDHSIHSKKNIYDKYKLYYGSNIDNYKNTPDYNRKQELNEFNKNKYYYNMSIDDKPKYYMTKENAIKEEIDETIENRFITIFLLSIWKSVLPNLTLSY